MFKEDYRKYMDTDVWVKKVKLNHSQTCFER